jgi:hypothetical protein
MVIVPPVCPSPSFGSVSQVMNCGSEVNLRLYGKHSQQDSHGGSASDHDWGFQRGRWDLQRCLSCHWRMSATISLVHRGMLQGVE